MWHTDRAGKTIFPVSDSTHANFLKCLPRTKKRSDPFGVTCVTLNFTFEFEEGWNSAHHPASTFWSDFLSRRRLEHQVKKGQLKYNQKIIIIIIKKVKLAIIPSHYMGFKSLFSVSRESHWDGFKELLFCFFYQSHSLCLMTSVPLKEHSHKKSASKD